MLEEKSFGMHKIKVIAYDSIGQTSEDRIMIFKLF